MKIEDEEARCILLERPRAPLSFLYDTVLKNRGSAAMAPTISGLEWSWLLLLRDTSIGSGCSMGNSQNCYA
jgi:hypothetical protein